MASRRDRDRRLPARRALPPPLRADRARPPAAAAARRAASRPTTCTPGSRRCRAPRALRRPPHGGRSWSSPKSSWRSVPAPRSLRTPAPRCDRRISCASSTSTRSCRASRRPRAGRGAGAPAAVRDGQPGRATCSCRRAASGDVRPMGEGSHARFTVASGGRAGPRGRVRGRRDGLAAMRSARSSTTARHDIVARLELNGWAGAVEPRLVVALAPLRAGGGSRRCRAGCSECTCRARRGAAGWTPCGATSCDAPLERPVVDAARQHSARTASTAAGEGVLGTLSGAAEHRRAGAGRLRRRLASPRPVRTASCRRSASEVHADLRLGTVRPR